MAENSTIGGGDTSARDGEFGSNKIRCVPAMILGGVKADDRWLLCEVLQLKQYNRELYHCRSTQRIRGFTAKSWGQSVATWGSAALAIQS
ncbi:unnamed protein product [Macrosiphum euphorbiae]|uniref:Uncharacterized protein n=1 Tax=Macrosiphum euphorbiae TaxID=13131 RepID=A0AAV0XN89_9HEMI|nr:unnamed protein product [Macrosiphum euphorbiae]